LASRVCIDPLFEPCDAVPDVNSLNVHSRKMSDAET